MNRTALMILRNFPPGGGAHPILGTKFTRYLPEFGWDTVVLTDENQVYGFQDHALMTELPPGLPIYRTKSLQPLAFYRNWKHKSQAANSDQIRTYKSRPAWQLHTFRTFRNVAQGVLDWVLFPDDQIGWVPYALRVGHKILQEHSIDVCFTLGVPFSSHIIGRRLTRKDGLPWVAEFGDPFVSDRRNPTAANTPLHNWFRKRLERAWVTDADRVISTTAATSHDFARRYPTLPTAKWKTVSLGYDEDEFAALTAAPPADRFVLTHVGSLYQSITPDTDVLLSAIRRLLDQDSRAAEQFNLVIVGKRDLVLEAQLRTGIARYDLAGVVQLYPPAPHRDVIQQMLDSTALLIMLSDRPGAELVIHSKTYEYMRAKKPILALLPDGAVRDLLQQMDSTCFVELDDRDGLTRQLQTWLDQWRAGNLPAPTNPGHERFNWRTLTGRLAQIFDEVT